jgi:hypothetical protein
MREGFYLSPDGKNIIELVEDRNWRYGFDILACDEYIDAISNIAKEDADILFSSWERLD